jgi:hypothetical protein
MSDSEMESNEAIASPAGHPPAVIAGFSGWLLDAFDFFLVTFCLTAMAREFHKTDAQIALVITMTLLFRPVGGFVFGILADRYGRRIPLMINMSAFAVAGILTGLSPNYTTLLVVRALFGMVMGGTWGVGASLAMEAAPANRRGLLSGLLQEGYAAGNVLAAILYLLPARGAARALHPVFRKGIHSVAAAGQNQAELGGATPRDSVPLEVVSLPACLHDGHDVRLARDPGHVPHLPAAPMAHVPPASRNHHCNLRHRRHRGGTRIRLLL